MNTNNKICRLCFKTCNENFDTIQEFTKEKLNVLVHMDFDISEDCVNCKKCTENLRKCFDFKSTCLQTEEKIIAFLESSNILKTNMSEVYFDDMQNLNSNLNFDEICRFCMKPLTDFFAIDETYDYFSDMLQKFLPDVTLNITINPVSCNNCLDSLKSYSSFFKYLQHVEEHIRAFCEESEIKEEKVELNNVVQHILKKISMDRVEKETVLTQDQTIETYFSELAVIKICIKDVRMIQKVSIEGLKEEISVDESYCLENLVENCKKDDTVRNCIKTEEIEIKTEETVESDFVRKEEKPMQFQCSSCTFKSNKKSNLLRHLEIIHEKDISFKNEEKCERFHCDNCNFTSTNKLSLASHMKRLHNTDLFYCGDCKYKTLDEECFKQHRTLHDKNGNLKCPECHKCFHSKMSMDDHLVKNHDNLRDLITVKIHSCDICNYKTAKKSHITKHVNIRHSQAEIYECHNCSRTFLQKDSLKKHIWSVHLKSRPFVCKMCKKTFYNKGMLDAHIVSQHQKNSDLMKSITSKIHQCEHCTFRSGYKRTMTRHVMKKHRNPETYSSGE